MSASASKIREHADTLRDVAVELERGDNGEALVRLVQEVHPYANEASVALGIAAAARFVRATEEALRDTARRVAKP